MRNQSKIATNKREHYTINTKTEAVYYLLRCTTFEVATARTS
jgi:hypothetical protein